jgi:hypothetical protein
MKSVDRDLTSADRWQMLVSCMSPGARSPHHRFTTSTSPHNTFPLLHHTSDSRDGMQPPGALEGSDRQTELLPSSSEFFPCAGVADTWGMPFGR